MTFSQQNSQQFFSQLRVCFVKNPHLETVNTEPLDLAFCVWRSGYVTSK